MRKEEMFRVYPTKPIKGFTHTYCKDRMSAEWEQLKMEIASGIEWKIQAPSVLY